jgi:hypothetical protein
MCTFPFFIAARGACRNKDRQDWGIVAREVEILEIEGIIPRLVVVGRMVVPLSTLEFNWENAGAGD